MIMFKKALVLASMGLLLTAGAALAGTPFGGDDGGFLAPGGAKGAVGKCEAGIAKSVTKAIDCIAKCHASRFSGKLADDTAEDSCEKANDGKSCLAKYFSATTKTLGKGGCASCSASNVPVIATTAETALDGNNGLVYCASPSGAFVDGVSSF
jgi:hypothetical protein